MQFNLISIFPQMFSSFTNFGITQRAVKNNIISLTTINPRDFTTNIHNTVDDRPFGGGAGMVMMYQPLADSINFCKLKNPNTKIIFVSPQGKVFNHQMAVDFSKEESITIICGRYEGVDERVIKEFVDEEVSLGDFVLSGGELPAMVIMDSVTRLLPNVLGNKNSAIEDSFFTGLLDHPHYTRPAKVEKAEEIPAVLLSGNHREIERWRLQQRVGRTHIRRPDLSKRLCLSQKYPKELEAFLKEEQDK